MERPGVAIRLRCRSAVAAALRAACTAQYSAESATSTYCTGSTQRHMADQGEASSIVLASGRTHFTVCKAG